MNAHSSNQRKTGGFEAVDQAKNPLALARYLNKINLLDTVRKYKSKVHAMLGIKTGDSILDVGCGIGIDTREIALLFGPKIKITGIDSSEIMIKVAKSFTVGKKNSAPITYAVQDAQALNFKDNEFDIVRADRTFQHLKNPRKALKEMIRVVKPGGKILIVDTNWESLNILGISREDLKTIKRTFKAIILNPNIAVHLKELMTEEGIPADKIDLEKTQLVLPNLASIEDVLWLETSLSKAEEVGAITQKDKLRCMFAFKRTDQDSIWAAVDLYIVRVIKT